MTSFLQEFRAAARRTPRIYFAPIIGAFKAIRAESQRMDPLAVRLEKKAIFDSDNAKPKAYRANRNRKFSAFR
jgi:hypothetical protein